MNLRVKTQHAGLILTIDVMALNSVIHDAMKYTPPEKRKFHELAAAVDLHRSIDAAVQAENEAIKAKAEEGIDRAIKQDNERRSTGMVLQSEIEDS